MVIIKFYGLYMYFCVDLVEANNIYILFLVIPQQHTTPIHVTTMAPVTSKLIKC